MSYFYSVHVVESVLGLEADRGTADITIETLRAHAGHFDTPDTSVSVEYIAGERTCSSAKGRPLEP